MASGHLTDELAGHGLGRVTLLLVFVGLEFAVEHLFARATAGLDARSGGVGEHGLLGRRG